MPKIKVHGHSPRIDMTPMVDLFMLLLTFFMLTTTFRPSESVQVDTPGSISEKLSPDMNIMTISIDKKNRIFFNLDNGSDTSRSVREEVLKEMATRYNVQLTEDELKKFSKLASFGTPMKNIKSWLNAQNEKEKIELENGIPIDSADNQLNMWILYSRVKNPEGEAIIKGDGSSDYEIVKKVLDILQENEINRFNLTTNLEKVEVQLSK